MQSIADSGSRSCWKEGREIDTGSWIVNQKTKARGGETVGCVPFFSFGEEPVGMGTTGLFNKDFSPSPPLTKRVHWLVLIP